MKPEVHGEGGRGMPEGPQRVWQSFHREGTPDMEMRLTTDQLCARARYRERENIWLQWIAVVVCLGFIAFLVYGAIATEHMPQRLALVWMALLTTLAMWGARRVGARRIEPGESCARFMVRELEGSRRTVLALRWGMVLVVPSLLVSWWGVDGAIRARAPYLAPELVRGLLPLLVFWVLLGFEAKKRARQADELRRAIGE